MAEFEYRRLARFTLHVLKSRRAIKPFLMKWMVDEWQSDHNMQAPDERWTVEWLERLPRMHFSLEVVSLRDIRPRADLMACRRPGYSFADELEARVQERDLSVRTRRQAVRR